MTPRYNMEWRRISEIISPLFTAEPKKKNAPVIPYSEMFHS
jgi:hypothetical protein